MLSVDTTTSATVQLASGLKSITMLSSVRHHKPVELVNLHSEAHGTVTWCVFSEIALGVLVLSSEQYTIILGDRSAKSNGRNAHTRRTLRRLSFDIQDSGRIRC